MNPRFPSFALELPPWVSEYFQERKGDFPTPENRMDLVTTLAELNVRHGTGGPFGAAVFRADTHELIAPGINLVLFSLSSIAHAEMVALTLAQKVVKSSDLGAAHLPEHELVTSCEPCAMCLGALSWSGIRHIICGARGSDAEAVGFDEGPKPLHWVDALQKRNISVTLDIGRKKAAEVLQRYVDQGGTVYNGQQGRGAPPL